MCCTFVFPAVLSNFAVLVMHVKLSTFVPPFPFLKPMCSVRQLADAIPPSLRRNVSLLTSLLLFCSLDHPFFLFPPLRCVRLFFMLGRSNLSSLSPSLFPLFISWFVCLLAYYWAPYWEIQGFILFLSFHRLFLSLHCVSWLACLYTVPSVSSPLCLHAGKNRCSSTSWILNRPHVKCWIFYNFVGYDVFFFCGHFALINAAFYLA